MGLYVKVFIVLYGDVGVKNGWLLIVLIAIVNSNLTK